MKQTIKWPIALIFALVATAPFVFALVVGIGISPIALLWPIILLMALTAYLSKEKLNTASSALTIVHVALWACILVGMTLKFDVPSYIGAAAAVGAIFSYGALTLVTLIVCIGSIIALFYKRNTRAANVLIFSASFLALQIGGLIIFLPGAAAH